MDIDNFLVMSLSGFDVKVTSTQKLSIIWNRINQNLSVILIEIVSEIILD